MEVLMILLFLACLAVLYFKPQKEGFGIFTVLVRHRPLLLYVHGRKHQCDPAEYDLLKERS